LFFEILQAFCIKRRTSQLILNLNAQLPYPFDRHLFVMLFDPAMKWWTLG